MTNNISGTNHISLFFKFLKFFCIFVIKKLSKFVGESIPIVDKKTNQMVGIISENDVLQAYLDISEEINQIEKH